MSVDEMIAADGRCLFRIHASAAVLDSAGRILLVQEQKAASRGKWNLPGGHVDHGESPVAAAIRETAEETHLSIRPLYLVGIYSRHRAVRFVCVAQHDGKMDARAGDEIMAVRWFAPSEILATEDGQMVSPAMLRQIVTDIGADRRLPLETVTHLA